MQTNQWPATAQLAQLTASARSPPPQDPDTPLNLSKQRSPSPAPQMMMPRFVPYPPMDESQYNMPKEEEYNAQCNSEYHRLINDTFFSRKIITLLLASSQLGKKECVWIAAGGVMWFVPYRKSYSDLRKNCQKNHFVLLDFS